MKADYLYRVGQSEGKPISWEELDKLYQANQLPEDAQVRKIDEVTWQPLATLMAAKRVEASAGSVWQHWLNQALLFLSRAGAAMAQHLSALCLAGMGTFRWGWQRQRAAAARVALGIDRQRRGQGSEETRAKLQRLDEVMAKGNFAQRWLAGTQRWYLHYQLGAENLAESSNDAMAVACRDADEATAALSSQAASAWQKLWPANKGQAGRLGVAYALVALLGLLVWRVAGAPHSESGRPSTVVARREIPRRKPVTSSVKVDNVPLRPENSGRTRKNANSPPTPPLVSPQQAQQLSPNNAAMTASQKTAAQNLSDVAEMLPASLKAGKFQPPNQGSPPAAAPQPGTSPTTPFSPPIIVGGRPGDITAAYIGHSIGKNASAAIRSASALRSASGDWSREIQTARQNYWNALRTGKNVEECRESFGNQLAAKDFWYFLEYMPMLGNDAGRARVLQAIAGKIDGGISESAMRPFVRWGTVFNEAVERHKREHPQQNFVEHLAAAHADEDVQQVHRNYLRARNWAELDASGIQFAWNEDDDAHVRMVLARYGEFRTAEQVEKIVAMLRDLFGEERFRKVAHELRVYPRGSDGLLSVREQDKQFISPYPDAALWTMLGQQDAEAFLAYKIYQEPGIPEETIKSVVNRWYDAYGRDTVLAAVEPLRTAPLGEYAWLRDPISLGSYRTAWHQTPYVALRDILSKKNPRGHIRAMIAFHEGTNSAAEIDRRLDELKRRYGEDKLLAAQQAIFVFHETPSAELLPEVVKRRESVKRGPEGGGDYPLFIAVLDRGAAAALGELSIQKREPTELSKHWLRFGVGTSVTHITKFHKIERGKRTDDAFHYLHTHKITDINEERIQLLRIEQRVDEINNFGRKVTKARSPHETQDSVIRWAKAGDPLAGRNDDFPSYSINHGGGDLDRLTGAPRRGSEQLHHDGKALDCETWEFAFKSSSILGHAQVQTQKIWLCDEIPGRLVKSIRTTNYLSNGKTTSQSVSEKVLSSFTVVPAK